MTIEEATKMKLKTVTPEQFKTFGPCWLTTAEGRERFRIVSALRPEWTALNVLALPDVSAKDKLWSVLREEFLPAELLHEFACRCAEYAFTFVENPDPRSVAAIEAKRAWLRGEITGVELAAARDAAVDTTEVAAWDAAVAAAWAAAWAAAEDAAWAAAEDAAEDAAEAAAWAAARAATWAAAEDAAEAAAWAAARAATWAAARAATWDAARAATWDAARAATWDAARDHEVEMLVELIVDVNAEESDHEPNDKAK